MSVGDCVWVCSLLGTGKGEDGIFSPSCLFPPPTGLGKCQFMNQGQAAAVFLARAVGNPWGQTLPE